MATKGRTTGAGPPGELLGPRALNRATLARQMLLERESMSAHDAIEWLVGMQSQNPVDPYIALWSRLDGFTTDELSDLMNERKVVRLNLMRATIHSVTAPDCLALRPLMQPVLERNANGAFGRALTGVDMDELAAVGRALAEEKPMTAKVYGERLTERWPDRERLALSATMRALVPVVQVTPRGVWGASMAATHVSAEVWLGRKFGPPLPREDLVTRYLRAFGPASVKDCQTWCGLTRLREVFEALDLMRFRDENGVELFDLADSPRPNPDTPAPVRFLPEYDNVLLGHADRSRFAGAGPSISFPENAHWSMLLVDGLLAARWRLTKDGDPTMIIDHFGKWSKKTTAAVEKEAARLLDFIAADVDYEIRIAPA